MTCPAAVGDMVTYLLRLGPATGVHIVSLWIDGLGTGTQRIAAHLRADDDPEALLTWLHLTGVQRKHYPESVAGTEPFTTWEGQSESGVTVAVFGRYAGDAIDQPAATAARGAG